MANLIFHQTANRACALLYCYIKQHSNGIWLLPVNVCPDVPLTFCEAKIVFEFVDIDNKTLCIDEAECIKRINSSAKQYAGIVYVRTYGMLEDSSDFYGKCKAINPEFQIIDDRCLCLPVSEPNMYGADMVLFSTGHCKQIDLNEGGLAFYNKPEQFTVDENLVFDGTDEEAIYKDAYQKKQTLRNIPTGWLKLSYFKEFDAYIDEIERHVSYRVSHRELLNQIYRSNLPLEIQLEEKFQNWRFNIRVGKDKKEMILTELFIQGLFASNHYHSVNRLFNSEQFPVSDTLFDTVINLFNDEHYSEEQAIKTTTIINQIINGTHTF